MIEAAAEAAEEAAADTAAATAAGAVAAAAAAAHFGQLESFFEVPEQKLKKRADIH